MALPLPILRILGLYGGAVADGLTDAYENRSIRRGFDLRSEKAVIFSDLHKGARNRADDFWRCERAYHAALGYYLVAGYHLHVLGDAEELWENKPEAVLAKYPETLALEAEFHADERYTRFWGNHDVDWKNPKRVKELAGHFPNGPPLEVHEALRFEVVDEDGALGTLFLVHGHQGTLFSDRASKVGRAFVRVFWGNLQRLTGWSSTTPAKDWKLRAEHDRAMAEWAFGQRSNKLVMVAGHTHHPVFATQLLIEEGTPGAEARAKREYYKAWARWRDPHDDRPPSYFNTGCCAFPDGDVTGLEIADGKVRLVRWPNNKDEPLRDILAEADLRSVFEHVAGEASETS